MATNIRFGTNNTFAVTLTDTNGVAVSGATVTTSLADTSDVPLTGQSWPLSLTEVGSTGVYTGTLQSPLHNIVRTQTVRATVVATKSGVPSTTVVDCYVEGDDD